MKTTNKVLSVVLVLSIVLSMGCVKDFVPQYKTIERSEPIYKTLMTVELDDDGDGNSAWVYTNVYNLEKTYTGTDFWGNRNYNVIVHYYIGTRKTYTQHTEINSIDTLDTYQRVIGHRTWTEKVRVN